MKYLIILYLITIPIVSFISYGLMFAFWQGEYESLKDKQYKYDIFVSLVIAFCSGLCGIVGLALVLVLSEDGKYGWRLK